MSRAYVGGIDFGIAKIDVDPYARAMHLDARDGVYANGTKIDNAIEAYYDGNRCYIDYGGGASLTVRNLDGRVVGWIDLALQ